MHQGILGIALLKCADLAKIILYRSKEQVLSTISIKSDTTVYVKLGYLQYHDNVGIYWSLHFSSDDDRDGFLNKIAELAVVEREPNQAIEEQSKAQASIETEPSASAPSSVSVAHEKHGAVVFRVAKVGHQLPKLDVLKNKRQDSDSSSSSLSPKEIPRKPPIFQGNASVSNIVHTVGRSSDQSIAASKPDLFAVPNNLMANIVMQQNNTNTGINNFLTESRVSSAESRMQLSKLETKLDRVLDKIDLLKLNAANRTGDDKDDEILQLEEKIVDLKKENRTLKQEIKELEKLTVDQQSAAVETDNAGVAALTEEINANKCTIDGLRTDATEKDKNIEDLHAQIKQLEAKLEEEKANSAKHSKAVQEAPVANQSSDLIRSIMNDLYQKLYNSLNERNTWPKQEVLKLSADLIRSETKAALLRQK